MSHLQICIQAAENLRLVLHLETSSTQNGILIVSDIISLIVLNTDFIKVK